MGFLDLRVIGCGASTTSDTKKVIQMFVRRLCPQLPGTASCFNGLLLFLGEHSEFVTRTYF